MDVTGGFVGDPGDCTEGPEPGLDQRLPILVMRGLKREWVVVAGHASEKVSRLPIVGYVMRTFVTPLFAAPPLERAEGALHEAVTFREFCRENPHPLGKWMMPLCAKREAAFDFSVTERGAEVCVFCRDRLALAESLLAAPAVRAVPAG